MRRTRHNQLLRDLNNTQKTSLIQPLFVSETATERAPISDIRGNFTETQKSIISTIESDLQRGINKFMLFCLPEKKITGDNPLEEVDTSFTTRVIRNIKEAFGENVLLVCDLCLCTIASNAQCGIDIGGIIDNESTLAILGSMGLQMAIAGADVIAPSGMMDGTVKAIRTVLDNNGFERVNIMNYSSKFASSFYGGFRDVCFKKGHVKPDRSTYQIDPPGRLDAIKSAVLDETDGVDYVIVKPAGYYLDIVRDVVGEVRIPVAAYHVSNEAVMMSLLSEGGYGDFDKLLKECIDCIRRAGANIIISYYARFASGM